MSKGLRFLLGCLAVTLITILIFSGLSAQPSASTLGPAPAVHASITSSPALSATPEPSMMIDPYHRLEPPPLSDPPTQAELGHYRYYLSCMVCHGDKGQGLTDEWRSVLDPEDQNCWQSKCHAANHPPEGFRAPRNAPAVIGAGTLRAYKTLADLFEHVSAKMPWPYPGLFEDEEYWQLTAFLADANHVDRGNAALGPDNAGSLLMQSGLVQTHVSSLKSERVVGGAVVVLFLSAALLQRWSQGR